MVEEDVEGRVVLNQPAGHVEAGESFIDAVIRETLEETAHPFEP
ncbi:MAG: NUDIX domain-containing protein, partial [Pseudomonadota bacterium]|nr:NUDIX domain-containing protein [Pseudomonadota bacterium]